MTIELVSQTRTFGGWHKQYSHSSSSLNCKMQFAVYLPPQVCTDNTGSVAEPVPVVYWLSGLTCNDENFMQKAGALRIAAELGIAIVAPDTSPRCPDLQGNEVADDENGAYDLGLGAGFYLNATQPPWADHYRMYDYVVDELPALIESHFPVSQKRSIAGHSMGGHGALTIALKNPDRYESVSAFSPIVNPVNCPWGEKAFTAYLGSDREQWKEYDSCELLAGVDSLAGRVPALVDQGLADNFLEEQLKPGNLQKIASEKDYPLMLRTHEGYDHSYYFIATFIEDHLRFHGERLF